MALADWTDTTKNQLYKFFAIAFDAAPGVTYMNTLYEAVVVGNMSVMDIMKVWTKRVEFTSVYPSYLDNVTFADRLVESVVGTAASAAVITEAKADIAAALNWAEGQGKTRSDARAEVIFQAFTNLTSGGDAAWTEKYGNVAKLVDNQVAYAKYYTETLLKGSEASPSMAALKAAIASVTPTTDVSSAAAIDAVLNPPVPVPGQNYALTVSVDTVAGGAGDDTVLGVVDTLTAANNTFSVADVINAGGGTDTLQVTVQNITGNTTFTPTQVTNTERVRVINVDATPDTATVDLTSTSGVTAVEASSSAAPVTFNNIANTAVALSAVSNTGAVNFNIKTAALTGTSDTVSLSLTSNSGGVNVNTNGAGFEAANVAVSGTNTGALIGAGADIKTLTVTGSGTLTVPGADLTAVTNLNAAANSGGVTYDATATNATLTGGSGNDSLTDGAGNDVIAGGAGNDTLTGGTANDNISGGDGDDRVVLTAVTKLDTVDGGAGNDTLSIAAAITYTASTSTDESVNIKGFERLTTTAAITQNMLGLNANNTIDTFVIGSAGTTVLQNVAGLATVSGATAGNLTLGLKTNGTADVLAVSVGDATNSASRAVTLNATQIETLNVTSVGGNGNTLTLGLSNAGDGVTAATASTATSLKTLTVAGSKNLTVTGSGADTSLATITAAGYSGTTLSLTGFGTTQTTAMTVTADGVYDATVTTAAGADSITSGAGNDSITANAGADTISSGAGNDTISGGTGNNVITAGAGNDSVTGGADADNIDAGDDNDTVSAGDGANTITGGSGNDSITSGINADSVSGGDGNDTITTSTGNDTIDAGAGDDSVNAGASNDSVVAGAGNDTIDAGTGDDFVSGGDGNDVITISSLSNGDSIDGGAGNDRLTITAISSDATPSGVAGIEDFRVTTIGGGATAITVDLNKVSGFTALQTTVEQDNGIALTVKALPSTLTALTLKGALNGGAATTETLSLSYASGPSALTLTAAGNTSGTTSITSLNAPLTISGRLNTDLAGDAQVYSNSAAQKNSFGALTTDATTLTISTEALATPIAGVELTVGAITDNVIQSLTVTGANNSDVTVGAMSTSSAEFSTLSVSTGNSATTTVGAVTANSSQVAVAATLTAGNQGTLKAGNIEATNSAITVTGTLGEQSSMDALTVKGKSIASSGFTVGAGVGTSVAQVVLPTLEVGANGGTIGNVTINVGAASFVKQTIGSTNKAATIGTVTVTGSGNAEVVLSETNSATVSTTGANTIGAVSASGMTSPLSSLKVVAGASVISKLSITGGSGNDTIAGGNVADTITGGAGVDNLTGNNGQDIFVFNVGDSNPVYTGNNSDATGQDTITANSTDTTQQLLQFNITSADTTWAMDHILVGTAGVATASASQGNTHGFATTTVLVQTGATAAAGAANTDAIDIVVNVGSALDAAQARAMSVVNVTGTSGDDSITTGANNDTISGGGGNDTLTGGAGGDVLDGGAGNDLYSATAASDSNLADGATNAVTLDTITFGTGDRIDTNLVETLGASGAMTTVTLAAGAEATGATLTAAIANAITEVANAFFLIKVVDNSTDSSFDGGFGGYYLVGCIDGTFSSNDYIVKLSGVSDSTTIAVSGSGGIIPGG